VPDVLISEVGLRDGLQSVAAVMDTDAKCRWIDALHGAGVREIEVGSFVPAALLPQLADTDKLVRHAAGKPGLSVVALVPNLKGAERAFACGVHKVTIPVSASEAQSRANVRKTRREMVAEVAAIAALRDRVAPRASVEVGISTAFGCTLQGEVPGDEVLRLAREVVAAGADGVGLSDTTGMGNPAQVRRLFSAMREAVGDRLGGAHMHNTRGLGLANCLAAYDTGVRTFDGSLAWAAALTRRAPRATW
jgi:hydroxymethylglutaryl-CoA lyase